MTPQRFGTYVVASSLAVCAIAACHETSSATPQTESTVGTAFDALSSAIADCGDAFGACAAAAAGDAAALQACRDGFGACQDSAGAPAASELADEVVECTQTVAPCARDAGGPGAAACSDDLRSCLGAVVPPGASDEDAGAGPGDHAAPVAPCIDDLLSCLMGGGEPRTCAGGVRACVIAHVPAPPGVIPDDPGSAAGDAGKPDDPGSGAGDAGMPGDVPTPHADAGTP